MKDLSAHTEYNSIKGRRVLITGGTTGIGRAIALRLAAEGARIILFGRHRKELDEAMEDLQQVSEEVTGLTADSARVADLEKVFAEVSQQWGGLDVLIANAAIGSGDLDGESSEAVEYALQVNITGYLHSAKMALARMEPGSHIVLVGSVSADNRNPGSSVYVATKSAIQGFAESFRQEASKEGIKVSLIEPGKTGSDMIDQDSAEQRESQEKLEMLKAEDIAVAVEYILTQPARCNVSVLKIHPARSAPEN